MEASEVKLSFRKSLILLACILIYSLHVNSQESTIDSLLTTLQHEKIDTSRVNILNELCWQESENNLERSIKFGQEAFKLANRIEYWKGAFIAKRFIGKAYHNFYEIENAIQQTNSALKISENHPIDQHEIALAHNELGAIFQEEGRYSEALEQYQIALRLSELDNDILMVGVLYINMSNVFNDLERYEEAITLSKKAAGIFEDMNEPIYVGFAFQMMGECFTRLGKWNLASEYLNKALNIFEDLEIVDRVGETMNGLGILYQEMHEYEKALHYYNLSMAIDISLGNSQNMSISYANIAGIYSEMNQLDTAIILLQKAWELAEDKWQKKHLMTTYLYTAETYEETGDYESAFKFHKLYDIVKDSIFSFEMKRELLKIQEEFNSKIKQEKINTLQIENENISSKSKFNYLILSLGIASLVIIILLILLYLKFYRAKMIQSKGELEKSIAGLKSASLMSQLNPHLVFNILNSIQGLVTNQEIEKTNRYISKFSKFMRQTLQLNQLNYIYIESELEIINQYFELEKLRFGDKIHLSCTNHVEIAKLNVPPLILQPIIENAIKHGILPSGNTGVINVEVNEENNYFIVQISDNGIGFDKNKKLNDGLRITQERLKMMNSDNSVEIRNYSNPTTIVLKFRKTNF